MEWKSRQEVDCGGDDQSERYRDTKIDKRTFKLLKH